MPKLHILGLNDDIKSLEQSTLASERLRLSLAVKGASLSGYTVSSGPIIPAEIDLVLVGKLTSAYGEKIVKSFISQLQICRAKIIVDYTDHWLAKPTTVEFSIYSELQKLATCITLPLIDLARCPEFRDDKTIVIPDGLDQFEMTSPKNHNSPAKVLLWFGHNSNIGSLLSYLDGDFGLNNFHLNVVSDSFGAQKISNYKFLPSRGFTIQSHLWSYETLKIVSGQSDLAIIPVGKKFASPNRILTAFLLGLPVIASQALSHQPFSEYFAQIGSNSAKKLFQNPNRWNTKVRLAQSKLYRVYDDKVLIEHWSNLFNPADFNSTI